VTHREAAVPHRLPGVEPIDVAGTIGVVSMAARILPAIEAVTIAHAAGPVTLASGLTVVAGHGSADAPPCDVTIVCGGPGWRKQLQDAVMLALLRSLDDGRDEVARIIEYLGWLSLRGLRPGQRPRSGRGHRGWRAIAELGCGAAACPEKSRWPAGGAGRLAG